MVAVAIQRLEKKYGDTVVLPGVNLRIEDGEFVTLLGPSGCGKTTMLRCVAGLERPSAGEIHFGDEVVVADDGRFISPNKRNLGMVFQSYALWPHMTVYGNVVYPLRASRVPSAQRAPRVKDALERVGLSHLATRSVGTLSGGQQQRVALARAIVGNPDVILFDEPLSNLDAKLRSSMRTELQLLHRTLGTTSLYVTHDQTEAMTLSDRVVVMNQGQIQQIGTPEEVYSTPANPFVADFIGVENLLNGAAGEAGSVVLRDGTRLAGRSIDLPAAGSPAQVAFRANAVEIQPDDEAAGVVLATTFLGDQREFLIDISSQQVRARIDIHHRSAQSLRPGDRVSLTARPEAVLIYAGEAPESTSTTAIGRLAAITR